MKTSIAATLAVVAMLGFGGTNAEAKSRWHRVADLKAGGEAKEVSVERQISEVLIRCTEGSVTINTIIVRAGNDKKPVAVSARIEKGEDKIVGVGDDKLVNGLRISDGGSGSYIVFVK